MASPGHSPALSSPARSRCMCEHLGHCSRTCHHADMVMHSSRNMAPHRCTCFQSNQWHSCCTQTDLSRCFHTCHHVCKDSHSSRSTAWDRCMHYQTSLSHRCTCTSRAPRWHRNRRSHMDLDSIRSSPPLRRIPGPPNLLDKRYRCTHHDHYSDMSCHVDRGLHASRRMARRRCMCYLSIRPDSQCM